MLRGIFRTKSVDEILASHDRPGQGMRKELGAVQVTLLGIGAVIGTGVFTLIGTAAAGDSQRPGAGTSLVLSFLISAIVCAFTALCYAELAAMVPISGSAYTYSYATLGELIAWIIGWDLIIEYAVGNVAVAISWSKYFRRMLLDLGVPFPFWLATDYRTAAAQGMLDQAPNVLGVPIVFNVLAFGIVMGITIILVRGVKESATFNAVMVAIKIAVLLFFVGMALWFVSPSTFSANWKPFFPQPQGWHGTLAGAAVIFFAYIGFDAVSTVAEETKNPSRNIPIGIIASLAICTIFYVVIGAVFTGMIPYAELTQIPADDRAEPLTLALSRVAPTAKWAVVILAFGSVVAQTAVLLVFQMGQPRIFFAMARDGLLPPIFARLHPTYRTPHITTILTGLVVGGLAGVANVDEMADLTNIGTLFAFVLVCLGIPILRRREPDRERKFRVPFGPYLLPALGASSCVGLMVYLPPTSWWRFVGWLILGLSVYCSYGFAHSTVGRDHGRTNRTPGGFRLAAIGFLAAALGMFLIPHEASLQSEIAEVKEARGADNARALWGFGLILAGLAAGAAGVATGLRKDDPPPEGP